MRTAAFLAIVFLAASAWGASAPGRPASLGAATAWLARESKRLIRACRRRMHSGRAAFPPQVGSHYDAFWLRDYAYMLEGCAEAFTDKELSDACSLFVGAQRADGACVDCVKFDGTSIYKPGYGRMGDHPVADGSQFTVAVAWHTWRRTRDRKLLLRIIDPLVRAMQASPRSKRTHLVHIRAGARWDRCPYGFTDTVRKQGDVLFCSLLYEESARRLADLLAAAGRKEDAATWRAEAERVGAATRKVFWDEAAGLFRAATARCGQPDIWGSAFAVYLGLANQAQSLRVARYFRDHYDGIVQCGQVRHLPGGVYWQEAGPKDRYQNGGFWATPVGWFVYTLDLVDPKLADRTVLDLVADFRRRGVREWVFGQTLAVGDYVASATLPLAGIRAMVRRRREKARPGAGSRADPS